MKSNVDRRSDVQADDKPSRPKNSQRSIQSTKIAADENRYKVQIAAYRYEENATKGLYLYNNMFLEQPLKFELLARVKESGAKKQINYRLRTQQMLKKQQAGEFCALIRSRGADCIVIRHNRRMWRSSA
ncbi:MAG: hypothetical protein CMM52_08255 [Rhodospirillaceae bacterium]|nr:hypothetical protein [Rhodospirillaceae bacterium]